VQATCSPGSGQVWPKNGTYTAERAVHSPISSDSCTVSMHHVGDYFITEQRLVLAFSLSIGFYNISWPSIHIYTQ
jgi:hypothetical protein